MVSQLPTPRSTIGDFVRVAAYISSYARSHLACVANQCGMKNVFYCDTDSLYVRFGCFPRMRIHFTRIGGWKLQSVMSRAIFIAPKCNLSYCTDLKQNGMQIGWSYKWKGVPMRMIKRNDP